MKTQEALHIYLDRQEAHLLLEALVEQPFKQVFEIIGTINQQLHTLPAQEAPECFRLLPNELSVCVKALGELPYNRVCALVNHIHRQLLTQGAPAAEQHRDLGKSDHLKQMSDSESVRSKEQQYDQC